MTSPGWGTTMENSVKFLKQLRVKKLVFYAFLFVTAEISLLNHKLLTTGIGSFRLPVRSKTNSILPVARAAHPA